MSENEKKPVINLLPAIMTGAAALLAALTTVYVNVRNDLKDDPPPVATVTAAPAATPEPAKPAAAKKLHLQLQRVAVQEDGAVGNADWRFAIEADGQPLFVFEQEAMTSAGGRNIVVVGADRAAAADLELKPGKPIAITVKGWRGGWLKKSDEPRVLGEAWLQAPGAMAPLLVKAQEEKQGAFTFYFMVSEQPE